jgi:hypothetical protein
MVDPKKFWIHCLRSDVKKGYDWIEIKGKRMSVTPGKYLKIYSPTHFGFEDLTEEVGEWWIDWDYDEPDVTVVEEKGLFRKNVKLHCRYTSNEVVNRLYYNNTLVHEFTPGFYEIDIEFSYLDLVPVLIGIGAVAVPLVILGTKYYKK